MKLAFSLLEFTEAAVQDARGSLALVGFAPSIWNVGEELPVVQQPTIVALVDEVPEAEESLPPQVDWAEIEYDDTFTLTVEVVGPTGKVAFHQSLPGQITKPPPNPAIGDDQRARLTVVLPVTLNIDAVGRYTAEMRLTDSAERTIASGKRRVQMSNLRLFDLAK